jgi:hypothetical protein
MSTNNATNNFGGGSSGGVKITTYDTPGSYTWTKDANAKYITVYGFDAGSGGASGECNNIGFPFGGGGGGAGGAAFRYSATATLFGATEAVTVGAGGAGGAGSNVSLPGTAGGLSKFGFLATKIGTGVPYGVSTVAGLPNYSVDDSYVLTSTTVIDINAGAGGDGDPGGDVSHDAPDCKNNYIFHATGGGGGGGNMIVGTSGARGGNLLAIDDTPIILGGGGGAVNTSGVDGTTVTTSSGLIIGGTGGGGGGSTEAGGTAGDGGNGGFPGGGGGGGGAGSADTAPYISGSGGDGADGLLVVIEFLG